MNQWAANGKRQDENRHGQLWELSGQGEQHCFELFVICLRDTEGSQTGENCSSQGVKEQRQRRDFLWRLRTEGDGWN